MMLISMILDPEACISDAGFFSVGPTNGRTDEQADSRSWIQMLFLSYKMLSFFAFPSMTKTIIPKVTKAFAWKYFDDRHDHTTRHLKRWRAA